MKKVLILIIAVLMVVSLAACGTTNDDGTTTTKKPDQTTTKEPEQTTSSDLGTETNPNPSDISLEDIANAIIATEGIEFSPMVMEIEKGTEWMSGLTKVPTGFSECWQFSPMIGVMPFVGYVFRVSDGTDVEAFKTELKENSNLNWNVCTSANTTICESKGNIVFFAMINIDDDMGLPSGIDTKMIASFNAEVNK